MWEIFSDITKFYQEINKDTSKLADNEKKIDEDAENMKKTFETSDSFFKKPEGISITGFSALLLIIIVLLVYYIFRMKKGIVVYRPPANSIEMGNLN